MVRRVLRRSLAVAATAGVMLFASAPANAGQDTASCEANAVTSVVLEDRAPCEAAESMVSTIRDALCRSAQRDPPDKIELSLDRAEGDLRIARIDVHYSDGRTTSRVLRGTCGPLLDAVDIVLSQIVERDEPRHEPSAPAAGTTPPSTNASVVAVPERKNAVPAPAVVVQRRAPPLSGTSYVGVSIVTGVLPALAVGPTFGLSLVTRIPFDLELRVDGGSYVPQSLTIMRFRALEGRLSICPGRLDIGAFSVKPCALLAMTDVDGESFAIRRVAGGSALVPSVGAGALGRVRLGSVFGVFIDVSALDRLNRVSWFVNGDAQIHRVGAFGAQMNVGVFGTL